MNYDANDFGISDDSNFPDVIPVALCSTVDANEVARFDVAGVGNDGTIYADIGAFELLGESVSAPTAPSDLVLTVVDASKIDLSWTDNSGTDETGFKIARAPDDGGVAGTWTEDYASTAQDVNSYRDDGLTGSTKYYYKVLAYNAGGDSDYLTPASATTEATVIPPMPISGLLRLILSPKSL